MARQSLLEKAQQRSRIRPHRHTYGPEEVEVIMAWLEDKIGITQIQKALEMKSSSHTYVWLCCGLREMYREGFLQEKP